MLIQVLVQGRLSRQGEDMAKQGDYSDHTNPILAIHERCMNACCHDRSAALLLLLGLLAGFHTDALPT